MDLFQSKREQTPSHGGRYMTLKAAARLALERETCRRERGVLVTSTDLNSVMDGVFLTQAFIRGPGPC